MKINNESIKHIFLRNLFSFSIVIIQIVFFGFPAPLIQNYSSRAGILISIVLTPWLTAVLMPFIFPEMTKKSLNQENPSLIKRIIQNSISPLILSIYGVIVYLSFPMFQYSVFFFFCLFILTFIRISGYLLNYAVKNFKARWASPDYRKDIAWLLSITALGLILRLWGINHGAPLYNAYPDEADNVERALSFFLVQKSDPAPFYYLASFSYLLAPFYAIQVFLQTVAGSIKDLAAVIPTDFSFYITPRLLSAVTGVLTIGLVYEIGRTLKNSTAGLAGAFFLSVADLHVYMSHIAKADIIIAACSAAVILFSLRIYQKGETPDYILAGISIALATSAKMNNILLFLPVFLALFIRSGRNLSAFPLKNTLILFSVFLCCLLIFNPYYLLAPGDLYYSFFREIIYGYNYPNDTIRYLSGWWFQLSYSLWFGLGFFLYITGLIGYLPFFYENKKMLFIFSIFPLFFFLLSGGVVRHIARYSLALLPFFCVTAGIAVSFFNEKIRKYLPGKKTAFLPAALSAVLISIPSLIKTADLDIFFTKKNNSAVARDYILKNIPQGSSIANSHILWVYSKATGLNNYRVSDYSPGASSDYVIVYYDFGMNIDEINSIKSNYQLEKSFIISKKKGMTFCDNESFHFYRNEFFERPRCDIELYRKRKIIN